MARPVLLDTDAGTLITPDPGATGDVLTSDAAGNATWQPAAAGTQTKRVYYNPGGQWTGNMGSTTVQSCGLRMLVKVPENTTRWRFVARNFDVSNPAGGAEQALTGTGLVIGLSAYGADGVRTHNFEGGVGTTLIGTNFPIPGDGSFFVSDWFTAANQQLQAATEYVLAVGYTRPTSGAVKNAVGQCYRWTTAASALNPAITSGGITTTLGTPLDWGIEYEVDTSRKHFFLVGDSIAEGITGISGGTNNTAWRQVPLWTAWPRQWAEGHDALVTMLAVNGFAAANYASASFDVMFDRFDWAAMKIDGVILALGANDVISQTLAQFQASISSINDKITARVGHQAPTWMCTVIPRNGLDGTQNTRRRSYNTWMFEQFPFGIAGVIDADYRFRVSSAQEDTYTPELYTDGIHASLRGLQVYASVAGATVG